MAEAVTRQSQKLLGEEISESPTLACVVINDPRHVQLHRYHDTLLTDLHSPRCFHVDQRIH